MSQSSQWSVFQEWILGKGNNNAVSFSSTFLVCHMHKPSFMDHAVVRISHKATLWNIWIHATKLDLCYSNSTKNILSLRWAIPSYYIQHRHAIFFIQSKSNFDFFLKNLSVLVDAHRFREKRDYVKVGEWRKVFQKIEGDFGILWCRINPKNNSIPVHMGRGSGIWIPCHLMKLVTEPSFLMLKTAL